jgi:hypothetical protein
MDTPSRASRTPARERGFIMAMLLAFCVILGILAQKGAMSAWAEVQRENELELIFRGEAYAKALALYRARSGQFPLTLEDLMKVKPPILRKLYKDPITNDDFELVTAVQAGPSGDKTGLPIAGVRSRSTKNGIIKYHEKELHSEWIFSGADDLYGVGGQGQQGIPGQLPAGLNRSGGANSGPAPGPGTPPPTRRNQ